MMNLKKRIQKTKKRSLKTKMKKGKRKKTYDGKGKGKGPTSWVCGEQGHTCWTCTKNPLNNEESKGWTTKGKGWNKGLNKGKGKGMNEIDHEQNYWNQMAERQEETNGLGGGALNLITEDWPVISTTTNRFTKKKQLNTSHKPENEEKVDKMLNGHRPEREKMLNGHRPEKTLSGH